MGTADSDEYTHNADYRYGQYLAEEAAAAKSFNRRLWLEPIVMLLAIFGYCALQAVMQHRDLQAQQAESAKQRDAICHIKQHNTLHEFNCHVINAKLAVIQ